MEEYLILAGDEAKRIGASSEAINLFNRAIKLIQNNTQYQSSKATINLLEEKLAIQKSTTRRERVQNRFERITRRHLFLSDKIWQ